MRYYKITITDPSGKLVQTASSIPGTDSTFTSYAANRTLPSALQIELDVPLSAYGTPLGGAMVRIWGISLAEIAAATDWNQQNVDGQFVSFGITIEAGMQKGLPLANSEQKGLIVAGSIYQAFGNWIGTDMTLDLILQPNVGTNQSPKNISFRWTARSSLGDAIRSTLNDAYANSATKPKIDIQIRSDVVLSNDEVGYYATVAQFAGYLKGISTSIIGRNDYPGIDVLFNNDAFTVTDHSKPRTPKPVKFEDLIGQPTWIESSTLQFKCTMRADLVLGDYVKMPPAVVTSNAAPSAALINRKATFQGVFYINEVRHVGNFRQPDAESWVSTFNAVTTPQAAAA